MEANPVFRKLIEKLLQKSAFVRSSATEILGLPEVAVIARQYLPPSQQHLEMPLPLTASIRSSKNSEQKSNSILTLLQKAKDQGLSPKPQP
jgi:hypothetical protein